MSLRVRRKNPDRVNKGLLSKKARKTLAAAKIAAESFDNKMFAEMYIYAVEQAVFQKDKSFLQFIKQLREPPVDIDTFLDSEDFFGATDLTLWPEVRRCIVNSNKYWWKGLAGGAINEMLLMGATGTGKCIPGYTEFLTSNGWKRIDQYVEGDLVAQYNEDGSYSLIHPTQYIDQENTEGFLKVESGVYSMEATPKHRIPYFASRTQKILTKTMLEVKDTHEDNIYGFKSKILATFTKQEDTKIDLTDHEIRLMVAVMADGSFGGNTRRGSKDRYCIFHVKKQHKKDRLVYLLEQAGIKYNKYDRKRGGSSSNIGYSDIAFLAPQKNKTYEGWWVANQEQLQVIRDEVLFWDGSIGKSDTFSTCDKNTAEFIQYVGSCTGSKTSLTTYDRVGRMRGVYERKSVEYTVVFQKGNTHSIAKGSYSDKLLFTETSHDREYCFTVASGLFIIRQNNHISVTGNSEAAKVSIAYHLHILGCMNKPQRYWGLPEATSIVFTIQAAKPHVTKKIIYLPLRTYVETMPWFQRHMRPNKILEGEMYFDDYNIRVVQGGSDSDAVLGDALIGGITDEINFMNVVEKSKKAGMGTGRSGNYDQAQAIYDTVTRRKKSRFLPKGPSIGIFCIASSTRYKNDFTDRRKAQVERLKDTTVYIYDKAQYEVRPADRYSGETFRLLVANEAAMDIRVLEDDEKVLGGTILDVPVEYKDDFEKDPAGSLRDIVGRSVNSINPFFRQQAKIMYCITKGEEQGLSSFLHKDNVVLGFEGLPIPIQGHYCTNPSKPRYVHIDLSNTQDRCGIAMVRFDGIEWVGREGGEAEALPIATVEMAVSLEPDHGHEIDIAEVRSWVKMLRVKYGYPIKAVTYDGWNSLESRQAWKKQGMKTGLVSVDRTSAPYKQLRDAMYDGRLFMYHQSVLIEELFGLEYDEKKDKVDHPITGGKDVADAVCGAYHTLLTRSSSWVLPAGGGNPMDADRIDLGDRFEVERPG